MWRSLLLPSCETQRPPSCQDLLKIYCLCKDSGRMYSTMMSKLPSLAIRMRFEEFCQGGICLCYIRAQRYFRHITGEAFGFNTANPIRNRSFNSVLSMVARDNCNNWTPVKRSLHIDSPAWFHQETQRLTEKIVNGDSAQVERGKTKTEHRQGAR